MSRAYRRAYGLVMLLVLSLFLTNLTPTQAADDTSRYFPETGYTVSGKFLEYWNTKGGLAVFGYPITAAQNEIDPETGNTYLIQWFERNRFELHPEKAGTPYEVLLGLLGKDLRREAIKFDPDYTRLEKATAPASTSGKTYFEPTGHFVSQGFYSYWLANGGLERFGYPIDEEHNEVDPETGNVYKTQWFERARFEYHSENVGTPYEILLGLLGNQIKKPKSPLEFAYKVSLDKLGIANFQRLHIDGQGNFYTVNRATGIIAKYNSNWELLLKWGGNGSSTENGKFNQLVNIAVDKAGNVYALSDPDDLVRVQKFDPEGHFLTSWKIVNTGDGTYSMAIDQNDNLYFAVSTDGGNGAYKPHKLYKYSSTGTLLKKWGYDGTDRSEFATQFSIAIDKNNNVYTLFFDTNYPYNEASKVGYLVKKYSSEGQSLGEWSNPKVAEGTIYGYIAVDNASNVYVGYDTKDRSQIDKYDSTGRLIYNWGKRGSADGQLPKMWSPIAVDQQGNVFVMGSDSPYLQKLRSRW